MAEKDDDSIPRNAESSVRGGSGIPVDSSGGPTVDPTKNVLDLVQAAVKRLDDLADVKDKRINERIDDEKSHIREILVLTRAYEDKLKDAEAKRIDSIRVVDVQAVQTANDKAMQQAQVLANNVTTQADALRALVTTTATTTAAQLTQLINPILDRIALLEKNQYQGAGKESVTDPIFQKLSEKIDSLGETRDQNTGGRLQTKDIITYILLAIAVASFIFNNLIK